MFSLLFRKIFNLFHKPVKKNKVFTETSRNTELVPDLHNDDEALLPKISGVIEILVIRKSG